MSLPIIVCIISGFFWAFFDLARKLSLKHINSKILLLLISIAQTLIFFIWCIKENFYLNVLAYLIPGFILIFLGIFSALIFLKSIKESELSLTIPLLSFSPLFSSLFSFLFLQEQLENIQYLGIINIIIGTLFLYSQKFKLSHLFKSIIIIKNNKSARLMIVVSLCWSITPVLDKMCLENSSINIHGFIQAFFTFIILFLISRSKLNQLYKLKEKSLILIIITILIGAFATIIQFYAILINFVPIVESIKRSIGQFGSVLFGKLFFNEKINIQKITGIALISYGVNIIL